MPPPLPDRYRLEVRLGREQDIEQWLGTDTSLDRPVLIRILGPEVDENRHREFLAAVTGAASIDHPHLARVFNAGRIPNGVFAVSEWAGGSTLADRLAAGDVMSVSDFLPNASGLAGALAALHSEGVTHGAIGLAAITYSVSHPAKLGGLGLAVGESSAAGDVRQLVKTLEHALTGYPPGATPLSEIVDGIHPAVDRILTKAKVGELSALRLAEELTAAPSPPPPRTDDGSWSRRLLAAAAVLAALAVALVGAGQLLGGGGTGRITIPIDPRSSPPAAAPATAVTQVSPTTEPGKTTVGPVDIVTIDPFGGEEENDELLPALRDGDPSTVWRSERYRDRLRLLKPGIGLGFRSEGAPTGLVLENLTALTSYQLGWAEGPSLERWEHISSGINSATTIEIQVPTREGGWWVLWMIDLPSNGAGEWIVELGEVRFER